MPYFVYLLECSDGTYYCGYTHNIAKRVATHNAGRGAKYTRARRPVTLVYSEQKRTMLAAMRRERAIKKLSRRQKEALVVSQK